MIYLTNFTCYINGMPLPRRYIFENRERGQANCATHNIARAPGWVASVVTVTVHFIEVLSFRFVTTEA
jgi:hypothetical protein